MSLISSKMNDVLELRKKTRDTRRYKKLVISAELDLNQLEERMSQDPIPTRFSAVVFSKASLVIRALLDQNNRMQRPLFLDDHERVLTYELTVNVLKYYAYLEEALYASEFYLRNPKLREQVIKEDIFVVMFDLMERNFLAHPDDPELTSRFEIVRDAVLNVRTKLMAHFARLRIQHEATALEFLLPQNIRHQNQSLLDKNPLYIWVNLKIARMPDVIECIQTNLKLREIRVEDDVLIQDKSFCVDPRHPDLVRFHSSQAENVKRCLILKEGKAVIQDKSACLFVYAMIKALFFKDCFHDGTILNPLGTKSSIPDLEPSQSSTSQSDSSSTWFDGIFDPRSNQMLKPSCVIVTHGGSSRSVAHLASLLQGAVPEYISRDNASGTGSDLATFMQERFMKRPPITVVAFGVPQHRFIEITRFLRKQLGLRNVKLYKEDFVTISPKDPRVHGACAILVNPPSSGSALKDPVAYICNEGGDDDVLIHMSQFINSTIPGSDTTYESTKYQSEVLEHALSFSQTKLVMYTTCSLLPMENGDLVSATVKAVRKHQKTLISESTQSIQGRKQSKKQRETLFEYVPLRELLPTYPGSYFNGAFFEMPPTSASSGSFIALIRKRDVSQPIIPNDKLVEVISGPSKSSKPKTAFVSRPLYTVPFVLKRRPMTRKAIVQRLSTPTYASMARSSEKWMDFVSTTNRPLTTPSTPVCSRPVTAKSLPMDRSRKRPASAKPTNLNIPPCIPEQCICRRHITVES